MKRAREEVPRTPLEAYVCDVYPAASIVAFLCPPGWCLAPRQRYLARMTIHNRWHHLKHHEVQRALRDAASLRQFLLAWQIQTLHAGAYVTSERVYAHSGLTEKRLARELVLDFDLRDWESQRPSSRALLCACDAESSCAQCWMLIDMAAVILRTYLGQLRGLGPMLVVFSGKKGAHFYFGTGPTRLLTERQRADLLLHDLEALRTSMASAPATSMAGRVREAMMAAWRRHMAARPQLLAAPTAPLSQWLAARLQRPVADVTQWAALEARTLERVLVPLVAHVAWPVVDQNALRLNHPVKLPFSVHAKSGRIALPLAEAAVPTFDPARSPTLAEVLVDPAPVRAGAALLDAWLADCRA